MNLRIDQSMLRLLTSLLLFGSVLSLEKPAEAHQIESALRYLNGDLELKSSFSNGQPTENAVVRLLNPDGTPGQELGRTNSAGRLILNIKNLENGVVDLQVDGGPGHRDYLELPIDSGAVNLDEVVSLPFGLVLVGLLASVRRQSD